MKTRQADEKSPVALLSASDKLTRRNSQQLTSRNLVRTCSVQSLALSSRAGNSTAGEELLASWNGKTFIVSGLQDHHWYELEKGKSKPEENLEVKAPMAINETGSPHSSVVTNNLNTDERPYENESQDNNHTPEPTKKTIKSGAKRGRPKRGTRGNNKSQLKTAVVPDADIKSDENDVIKESAELNNADHQQNKSNIKNPEINVESAEVDNNLPNSHEPPAAETVASTSRHSSPVELDDTLDPEDMPPAFLSRPSTPGSDEELDAAALLMHERFLPLPPFSSFTDALTRLPPSARTTATLYALADNAQKALVAWQTEYLQLDARTAPTAHPPKRAAIGGRIPMDPVTWDAVKQSELYGYTLDPRREPSAQDPFSQKGWRRGGTFTSAARPAESAVGRGTSRGRPPKVARAVSANKRVSSQDGRELRLQRKRGYADSDEGEAEIEEEQEDLYDANDEEYALGPNKKARRSTARFDGDTSDAKRGSAGPDGEAKPERRRGRPSAATVLARQLEAQREATPPAPQAPRRRGRPPGSKNSARRSDAGIKKGPRLKSGIASAAISRTATPTGLSSSAADDGHFTNDGDPSGSQSPMRRVGADNARVPPSIASAKTASASPALSSFGQALNTKTSLLPSTTSSLPVEEAISPSNPTPNPYLEPPRPTPSPLSLHSQPTTSSSRPKPTGKKVEDRNLQEQSQPQESSSDHPTPATQQSHTPQHRQPKKKSEKRSTSATQAWALRKAKMAEVKRESATPSMSPAPARADVADGSREGSGSLRDGHGKEGTDGGGHDGQDITAGAAGREMSEEDSMLGVDSGTEGEDDEVVGTGTGAGAGAGAGAGMNDLSEPTGVAGNPDHVEDVTWSKGYDRDITENDTTGKSASKEERERERIEAEDGMLEDEGRDKAAAAATAPPSPPSPPSSLLNIPAPAASTPPPAAAAAVAAAVSSTAPAENAVP